MASIGRLFWEVGAKSTLPADLLASIESLKSVGTEASRAGQQVIAGFNQALNPTKRLGEELALLEKAGKSNSEIYAVYGSRLQSAAAAATANKQAIDPLVQKHLDLNKATSSGTTTQNGFIKSLGTVQQTLLGLGIAFGTAQIARKIYEIGEASVKMAMAAVESESLFAVSMGGMADSATKWSKSLSESLGLNEYELRKSIGTFNVMFKSMGLGEQASYDMSAALVELANDMASFYNLPTEEAFEKLRAGITGETEPLKRLGILVDENTTKTYAYTHGIAETGKELTQQEKVLARFGSIMAQTSAAQGDLARTMDSPANQARIMGAQFEELQTTLGMAFLPALSSVVSALSDFVRAVDVGNSGLQELAKIVAAPVMGFYVLARANAELNLQLATFANWLAKIDPTATDEQVKRTATAMRDAARSVLDWNEKIEKLETSVDNLGKITSDTNIKVQAAATISIEAAKATQQQKEAQEKLNAAFSKAVASDIVNMEKNVANATRDAAKAAETATQRFIELNNDGIRQLIDSTLRFESELSRLGPAARQAEKDIKGMATRTGMVIKEEAQQSMIDLGDYVVTDIPEAFEESGEKSRDGFLSQVSTIWTNFSQDLAAQIVSGDFKLVDAFKSLGKSLLSALIESLITPFTDAFTKAISGMLSSITGKLGDWAGGALNSIFGSGSSAAGGAASAAGGVASLGASALSGAVSGVVSGIIGLFDKDKWVEVEQNTRYTAINSTEIINRLWAIEARINEQIHPVLYNTLEKIDEINWYTYDAMQELKGIGEALQPLQNFAEGIVDAVYDAADWIADAVSSAVRETASYVEDAVDAFASSVPAYATGTSYVPRSGLAMLHEGERVIPKGGGVATGGLTVNINGPVYGVDDLDKKIAASIKRTKGRGGLNFL